MLSQDNNHVQHSLDLTKAILSVLGLLHPETDDRHQTRKRFTSAHAGKTHVKAFKVTRIALNVKEARSK